MYQRLICIFLFLLFCFFVTSCTPETEEIITEAYPVPSKPVAAVQRALAGIEARNWELYSSSFEPTTTLSFPPPGISGQFENLQYQWLCCVDETEEKTREAVIFVRGIWKPSSFAVGTGQVQHDSQVFLNFPVGVVKAKTTIPAGVSVPVLEGLPVSPGFNVYVEGWFIKWNENNIPFDLNAPENFREPLNVPGSFAMVREGDIWLTDGMEKQEIQFTEGADLDSMPIWSPYYQFIAFNRLPSSTGEDQLPQKCMWVNVNTRRIESFEDPRKCTILGWLPHRNKFIVQVYRLEYKTDYCIIDAMNGSIECLVDKSFLSNIHKVKWSPDGSSLAIMGADENTKELLMVYDMYSHEFTTISNQISYSSDLEWSPNNHEIAFVEESLQEANNNEASYKLIIYPVSYLPGAPLTVTTNTTTFYGLSWSATGKYLTFFDNKAIYVYDAIRTKLEEVWRIDDISYLSPMWSPVNNKLAFADSETNAVYVWTPEQISASPLSQLREWTIFYGDYGLASERTLKWSDDGNWIIAEGIYFDTMLYLLDVNKRSVYILAGDVKGNSRCRSQWIENRNILYAVDSRDVDGDATILYEHPEQNEVIVFDTNGAYRWVTENAIADSCPAWGDYEIP